MSSPDATAAAPASWVATLSPGYFALVMATGILAVGARQLDVPVLDVVLAVLAAAAFVVLSVATVARLVRFPRLLLADLTSHARGFAFTTTVAGMQVLGAVALTVFGWRPVAWVLWWAGLVLWVVLVHTALIAVVLSADKPGIGAGINGTWFLLTVSTESVAVLGALLLREGDRALALVCVAFFGLGAVLYLIVMTLMFLRWTFARHGPAEDEAPTWIASGAVAITSVAASTLLVAGAADPVLARIEPALVLVAVTAWATATFWFPLMIAIGVWRHVVHRLPLRYQPAYWSLVFPLGMYAVATEDLRTTLDLDVLAWLPPVAFGVGMLAWAATALGLLTSGRRIHRPVRQG